MYFHTVQVQWTLSGLVRHFLLCASAGLLCCLAGTEGFHAKQANNLIKPIARRFYLFRIWKSGVLFNKTTHQVGARWTLFSRWLVYASVNHCSSNGPSTPPLLPLLLWEKKTSSPLSCVIIDRVQYTQASSYNWWQILCCALLSLFRNRLLGIFRRLSRGKKSRGVTRRTSASS